jgi:uncharacterized membrane protein
VTNELNTSYFLGVSLVPALLAAGLVRWQLGKNPVRLTGSQTTIVILATIFSVVATFFGALRVIGASEPGESQPWQQPFMLLSGLVGYFVGKAIASEMRKSRPSE